MKPYEEIDFPNGFLRWIREDGMYGCTLTEGQMAKIKAIHEAPRTWVGLTDEEISAIAWNFKVDSQVIRLVELEVMERNL